MHRTFNTRNWKKNKNNKNRRKEIIKIKHKFDGNKTAN